MFSAGAAMARGRCGVLLLLFLVLGIRVSWGQGGRHTGVARVRAVHGDKNILSVTSVGLCGFHTVTW